LILGATDHPGFGSFVLAGPGGVLAEISAQASVRLGSVDLTTARAMLQEARRRQATGRRVGHAATSMLRLGRPSLSRTTRRSSPCRASICCSNRTDAQTRSGAKWGRVEGGCKRSRLLLASSLLGEGRDLRDRHAMAASVSTLACRGIMSIQSGRKTRSAEVVDNRANDCFPGKAARSAR